MIKRSLETLYKNSARSLEVNYLTQNEINLIITTFLQKNAESNKILNHLKITLSKTIISLEYAGYY